MEYLKTDEGDLEWQAKEMKKKMCDKIDECLKESKEELVRSQEKYSQAKKDLDLLEKTKSEIYSKNLNKLEAEIVKENFRKSLQEQEAGEIVNIIQGNGKFRLFYQNLESMGSKEELMNTYSLTNKEKESGTFATLFSKNLKECAKNIDQI